MSTAVCTSGVADCALQHANSMVKCAAYNGEYINPEGNLWILICAFVVMAVMAIGIGANDTANSWGTSVGSGAISVRWACILGGLGDWLGAVTLGHGVSDTIQKGVAEINDKDCWACGQCNSLVTVYSAGMFGALIGAAIFLLLATYTSMPVSTTHAIVGGVVGMTLVGVGGSCLNWDFKSGLSGIIASWLISPLLSGFIGLICYYFTDWIIFKAKSPRRNAMIFMPFLYAFAVFFVVFMTLLKAKPTKNWGKEIMLIASAGVAVVVAITTQVLLVPYVRVRLLSSSRCDQKLDLELDSSDLLNSPENTHHSAVVTPGLRKTPKEQADFDRKSMVRSDEGGDRLSEVNHVSLELIIEERELTEEQRDAMFIFRYILILVATLESFAHGTNDTGNATAALSAVYVIYTDGFNACKSMDTPVWIMAVAGFFVFVGVNTMGYRVMNTIGSGISAVNLHRGFCMEMASTITVVIATILKFPVSTTHCQVGAVVMVSLAAFGRDKVEMGMLGRIVASWVLTIPFAGAIAAAILAILRVGMKA